MKPLAKWVQTTVAPDVHCALKIQAAEDGTTVHQIVHDLLTEHTRERLEHMNAVVARIRAEQKPRPQDRDDGSQNS